MTTNELIALLQKVENKDEQLSFEAVVGCDSNSRKEYVYFGKIELCDKDITKGSPKLVMCD